MQQMNQNHASSVTTTSTTTVTTTPQSIQSNNNKFIHKLKIKPSPAIKQKLKKSLQNSTTITVAGQQQHQSETSPAIGSSSTANESASPTKEKVSRLSKGQTQDNSENNRHPICRPSTSNGRMSASMPNR